jgi:hypothetical protein
MILRDTISHYDKNNKSIVAKVAHAHCCSKCMMRHKAAIATVLEFIAKGKRNNKRI